MLRFSVVLCAIAINIASGAVVAHSSSLRTGSLVSTQTQSVRDEPKGKAEDLSKKMPLKAQEQGFEGEKVKHADGKTGTADWQKEYGHEKSAPVATEHKSGCFRCSILSAMMLVVCAWL
mmetsp:Transcript_95086/g.150363  ORF Transcript_95086/g.150363 Transcript_95086/m.150363 type:complete len:119 (+) Transcript_95086:75-431(+)